MNQNKLEHFGIKGMRWGVRKSRPQGVQTFRKKTVTTAMKDELEAAKRRTWAKESLDDDIDIITEKYTKGKIDQNKYKQEVQSLKEWYKKEMNVSGADIRAERVTFGRNLIGMTLAIFAVKGVTIAMDIAMRKRAMQQIDLLMQKL